MLGSVFLQRTSLKSGGKTVFQGETSPPRDWDKRMRKQMEEKEVRSRCGVNRHKTSPKSGAPWKRTIIVNQLRANLTTSSRKSEMRTGLQAKSRDLCIFPQSAPHLTSDQQLPPSVWQGFLYCFILRSCCSTGGQRAAMETWTDVGCICILSHAKLRLFLKEFSGAHQQNQVNTHMQSLSSELSHLCFIPASCIYKVNRTCDCLWKC